MKKKVKKYSVGGGLKPDTSFLSDDDLAIYNGLPDEEKEAFLANKQGLDDSSVVQGGGVADVVTNKAKPGTGVGAFLKNAGSAIPYAAAGELAGGLVDKATNGNGISVAGRGVSTALKRAGEGAALGSIIPGVGTAVGAGIGAIEGGIEGVITGSADKKRQNDLIAAQKAAMAREVAIKAEKTIGYTGNLKKGGKIVGKGTGKSDSIKAELDGDGFVVPVEHAKAAQALVEKYFPGEDAEEKADLHEGDQDVKVSNGEYYIPPEKVKLLQAKGVDLNKFAPNAEPDNKLANGGEVPDNDELADEKENNEIQGTDLKNGGGINIKPSHKGLLHKKLGIKSGDKIPAKDLEVHKGDSSATVKQKTFAKNARGWSHKDGGTVSGYKAGGGIAKYASGGYIKIGKSDYLDEATGKIFNLKNEKGKIALVDSGKKATETENYLSKKKGFILPDGSTYSGGKITNGKQSIEAIKSVDPVGEYNDYQASLKIVPNVNLPKVSGEAKNATAPQGVQTASTTTTPTTISKPSAGSGISKSLKWIQPPYVTPATDSGVINVGDEKASTNYDPTNDLGQQVEDRTTLDFSNKNATPGSGVANESWYDKLGGTEGLLAAGQAGLGVTNYLSLGKRPEDAIDPAYVKAVADAQNEAKYGLSPAERAIAENNIATNRSNDIETIKNLSNGNSGTALSNVRSATMNADNTLGALSAQSEQMRIGKRQYADSMTANLAEMKRRLFEDKMKAFDTNQQVSGNLIGAGIQNYIGALREKNFTRAERDANGIRNSWSTTLGT